MDQPRLTTTLRIPQPQLDLSGDETFSLELVIAVDASKPVMLYYWDSFLWPSKAFREGGIKIVPAEGDSDPLPTPVITVCRPHARQWTRNHFITLYPQTPIVIKVVLDLPAFRQWEATADSNSGTETEVITDVDARFDLLTELLETGKSYKVRLPSAPKITWWCWKTPSLKTVQYRTMGRVPILPRDQQLPIEIINSDATFTCIGQQKKRSESIPGDMVRISGGTERMTLSPTASSSETKDHMDGFFSRCRKRFMKH